MERVLAWLLGNESTDPLVRVGRIVLVLFAIAASVVNASSGHLGRIIFTAILVLGLFLATWAVNLVIRGRNTYAKLIGRTLATVILIAIMSLFVCTVSYFIVGKPAGLAHLLGEEKKYETDPEVQATLEHIEKEIASLSAKFDAATARDVDRELKQAEKNGRLTLRDRERVSQLKLQFSKVTETVKVVDTPKGGAVSAATPPPQPLDQKKPSQTPPGSASQARAASITAIPQSGSSIQPFAAEYVIFRNGKEVGRATVTLLDVGDGTWEFSNETKGTKGMANLLGLDVIEKSTFRWRDGQPEGLTYRYSQHTATKSRAVSIDFDWNEEEARTLDGKNETIASLNGTAIDRNLVTLALMTRLQNGVSDLTLPVVSKDDVESQHYIAAAQETLPLPDGRLEVVRVERQDDNKNRMKAIWFSPQLKWLPVLMVQIANKGDADNGDAMVQMWLPRAEDLAQIGWTNKGRTN